MSSAPTPLALLARLRRTHNAPEAIARPDPDAVRTVLQRLGIPPDQHDARIAAFSSDRDKFVRSLLLAIVEAVRLESADLAELLTDESFLVAAELQSTEFNAQAAQAENGGWLIVLNSGLISLLYKAARTLMRHFDGAGVDLDSSEIDRSAALLVPPLSWLSAAGVPLGPDFEVARDRLFRANRVTVYAEQFVLAHELAHHLLGHTRTVPRDLNQSDQLVEAADRSWDDELAADRLGLKLVLEAQTPAPAATYATVYFGVVLVFWILDLLEKIAPDDQRSHPPAQLRQRKIEETLGARLDGEALSQVRALADSAAALLSALRDRVLAHFTPPLSTSLRQQFEQRFALHLEAASAGRIPDYVGFGAACANDLRTFPVHLAADVLADAARTAVADIEKQDGQAYVRLKLLLSLCIHMPRLASAVDRIVDEPLFRSLIQSSR